MFYALSGGCDREALDLICPDLSEGELVFSELYRDDSVSASTQWIELRYLGTEARNLLGLGVGVRTLSQKAPAPWMMKVREDLWVEPDELVVLGTTDSEEFAEALDYDFGPDMQKTFHTDGFLDLYVCDDTPYLSVKYEPLDSGSRVFDGEEQCNDDSRTAYGELLVAGTPGEENITCPE